MGDEMTKERLQKVVISLAAAVTVAVLMPLAAAADETVTIGAPLVDPTRAARTEGETLVLRAEVLVRYPAAACPSGIPGAVACFMRSGGSIVPGLGTVEASYPYFVEETPPGCAANQVRVLPTAARLQVRNKGEIQIRVAGSGCLDRVPPLRLRADEAFTVTGGSGVYAGASGGGTLATVSYGPPSFGGMDAWTGTLIVPGLSFDLTAPALTAPGSKTIRVPRRVKRVRVAYVVVAQDDVDGGVPVTCLPRSGSWFPVGRTRVRCSAADTSGNASTTSFVVTVKRKPSERTPGNNRSGREFHSGFPDRLVGDGARVLGSA
jgi:HYR domain